MKTIRIGNAAGFWGDNIDAPKRLTTVGELDYLTLEYLAELTLSILAYQKSKRPEAGFVTDVANVVRSLVPEFKSQSRLKLVTNGGGMNPAGCAKSVADVLNESGLPETKIAACSGDDVLANFETHIAAGEEFLHFETGEPLCENGKPKSKSLARMRTWARRGLWMHSRRAHELF